MRTRSPRQLAAIVLKKVLRCASEPAPRVLTQTLEPVDEKGTGAPAVCRTGSRKLAEHSAGLRAQNQPAGQAEIHSAIQRRGRAGAGSVEEAMLASVAVIQVLHA